MAHSNDLMNFGEHRARTYGYVLVHHPDYAAWAVRAARAQSTSAGLRRFAAWVVSQTFAEDDADAPQACDSSLVQPVTIIPTRAAQPGDQAVCDARNFWELQVECGEAARIRERYLDNTALHELIESMTRGRLCTTCTPEHHNTGRVLDYSPLHEFYQDPTAAYHRIYGFCAEAKAIYVETVGTGPSSYICLARTIFDPVLLVPPRGDYRCRQRVQLASKSNTTSAASASDRRIARVLADKIPSARPRATQGFVTVVDQRDSKLLIVAFTFADVHASVNVQDVQYPGLLAVDRETVEDMRRAAAATQEEDAHPDDLVIIEGAAADPADHAQQAARLRELRAGRR